MRKHFLKVSLIGLLAVSMPMSFTSCKDYDDDIEALENSNADLSNQLSALQAALTANQQAATAAQSAADAAKAAADAAQNSADAAAKEAAAAKQEAELAKKAAAEAKAEAIEEAIDQVKSMLSGYATSAQLATLAGTVEGIQKGLSTLEASLNEANAEIDENARAIEAIKVQVAALEKFQAETGKDISAIKAEIESLKSQLNAKITKDEVNALLNEANAKLTKELNSAVSTLQGVISNRLSSITLVPNLYIDGIETIEFVSLQYENKDKAGDVVLISTEENEVQYRLNPTTVGESDIDAANINFVALQATARGVVEAPIAFAKFNGIDKNGIMSIYAKKANTKSLNLPGNQIYTVAVEVPIAKDLCDAENPDQKVYSEYARLYEGVKEPHIAKKPYTCPAGHADCADGAHYYDATIWDASVANDECVVKEVNYNETLDLRTLVTGCAIEDISLEDGSIKTVATQMTAEQLAKYGLEFRFAIPTQKYDTDAPNGTNQQVFGALKEDGYTIYSKLPNNMTDNRAAIDKQPIVMVELFDVKNNKVADRRYFKIKWTEKAQVPVKDMPTVVITEWNHPTEILGCEETSMGLNWEYFINNVYAPELKADIQVPNEDGTAYVTVNEVVKPDMSYEDFYTIYPEENVTITLVSLNADGSAGSNNDVQLPVLYSNVNADANALGWTLTPEEIGTIIKINSSTVLHSYELVNNSYVATITWTPTDKKKYATLQMKITRTFELGVVPSINGFFGNYWADDYKTYEVYPIQYSTPAQKERGNQTCEFYNNLMNGYTFAANGFIVKDLSDCGTWDMQFCHDNQQAGYAPNFVGPEPDKNTGSDIGGYNLVKGSTQAAKLVWDEGHSAWCGNTAHNQTYVELYKNDAGKYLVENGGRTSHVGIWATINPWNIIPVYDYDLKFIEPLNISTAALEGEFQDGIMYGSKFTWQDVFTMRDCFGYKVGGANGNSEKDKYATELAPYYEVETPTWVFDDPASKKVNIKFGFKWDGKNIVVNPDATVDTAMDILTLESYTTGGNIPSLQVEGDNDEYLVFYSNMGSQVNQEFYIWAEVGVTYGWGSGHAWIPIKVRPMDSKE